ncbi:parapinopsin-like [Megalops cyprinoides]|uniref:parapinopsin-like n=1 Tax=Megalops cyprinoides TaxID=118141 RepID=UPI0018653089|nr:parapinopsin-like [Megalops cyprinoides]
MEHAAIFAHNSTFKEIVKEYAFPPSVYTALSIVMAIFTSASIILNGTVIIVTLRHRQLRQPLNYALVNLAAADLGSTLTGGLLSVVTNAKGYFWLGRKACVFEGFSVAFFGIAALCTVAVIAVERMVVVCKPLGTVMFQTKHGATGLAIAWVWSLVWNTPPLFGWGSYQLEGVGTSCAPDWHSRDPANVSYILCYFFLCFAVPFVIIVVCYSRLLWTLRQVARLGFVEGGAAAKAEARVGRMVVVMVLAFLVGWMPYACVSLAVIIDPELHINPIIGTVPVYLAKSSTVYNPLIYIYMNRQFQGYAVPFLLCGRNPRALEEEGSEADTVVATMNVKSSGKVSPM